MFTDIQRTKYDMNIRWLWVYAKVKASVKLYIWGEWLCFDFMFSFIHISNIINIDFFLVFLFDFLRIYKGFWAINILCSKLRTFISGWFDLSCPFETNMLYTNRSSYCQICFPLSKCSVHAIYKSLTIVELIQFTQLKMQSAALKTLLSHWEEKWSRYVTILVWTTSNQINKLCA